MIRLYAASAKAVAVVEEGDVRLSLDGMGARSVAVSPYDSDTVYVGTTDEGIFASADGGESWERLPGPDIRRITALLAVPDGALYAGTEPSSLYISRDGGQTWRELAGLKNLPSAPTWSFPPRPWTSHVRAIAVCHEDPEIILAGIELGGVMRSTDGGEHWEDQRPGAYADCHALATAPGVVYEAAGGGFAESADAGASFTASDEGIEHRYVWGLVVDAEDPGLLYISAAHGPMRAHGPGFSDAAIYRRHNGIWKETISGLAQFPYALAAPRAGLVYAGFGDGSIMSSVDGGESWSEAGHVPGVDAMAAVEI